MTIDENIFEWDDDYNIGVDEIDNAHRQLFRIVSRIAVIFKEGDFDKNKSTCIEAVKYLKSYAAKHFAEEEAYQLKIGYKGFEKHREVHENMKNVVIPALEKEMEVKSYSKGSIAHFLGVCAGWLTAHILIEDRAIVGKVKSKWVAKSNDRDANHLAEIIRGYSSSLFSMNAELFSKKYTGHKLDTLFCYKDVLVLEDGTICTVYTAIEHSMLKIIAHRLVKSEIMVLDSVMLPMLSEMMRSFDMEVATAFLGYRPEHKGGCAIPEENFYTVYDSAYPDHSLLWRTYCGHFAFVVKKQLPNP